MGWTDVPKPSESSTYAASFSGGDPIGITLAFTYSISSVTTSVTTGWTDITKPTITSWVSVAKPID